MKNLNSFKGGSHGRKTRVEPIIRPKNLFSR